MVGDGLCDDVTNTPECLFDGGDCCGGGTWICTYCKCKCQCNSAGSTQSDGSECINILGKDNVTGICCDSYYDSNNHTDAAHYGCTCKPGYSGFHCDECDTGYSKTTLNGQITCTCKLNTFSHGEQLSFFISLSLLSI